jgi:hypothetical protein
MKQLDPSLPPSEIFTILGATAVDMADAGGPLATGAGLINAERAVARVAGVRLTGAVFEDVDRDGSPSAAAVPLADATVFLDLNDNGLLDRAGAANAATAYLGFESSGPAPIGTRTLLENPNTPNNGPLQRPFTAISEIQVSALPGVVTDLGVLFTLRSDRLLEGQSIGPLFVSLVSPGGVRVPLVGSTVFGEGTSESPFSVDAFRLPADGQAYPQLVSQFETPISQFLDGSGHASLSQVDLAALIGANPDGRWQLEVRNAASDPAQTATLESWKLFLQTAEPSVQTDAAGRYAFSGLSPSDISGPIVPRLVVPQDRGLLWPSVGQEFIAAAGEQFVDANFAVSPQGLMIRPPLRRSTAIRVERAVAGPQPMLFLQVDPAIASLIQPNAEGLVVVHAVAGRVERWNGSRWIDVSPPAASAVPRESAAALVSRMIRPTDRLRWLPPTAGGGRQAAFEILGLQRAPVEPDASAGSPLEETTAAVVGRPRGTVTEWRSWYHGVHRGNDNARHHET